MAPGMPGRGGAALLCLSALLAHGEYRGADSGVKMRREPLEGAERSLEKENLHPRTRSRRSQLSISSGSSSYLQPPNPSAGAEAARPALRTESGPGRKRARGGTAPTSSWLESRVQTRESGGVSAHGNLKGPEGSAGSRPGRPSFHSQPGSRRG